MLRAKQITETQSAGRSLAPYFNGAGLQLRLAIAIRKARELCLPGLKRNKRVKATGNKKARLRVDRRLRYALVTLRRMMRASNALDQWLNEFLGAYPVYKDQRKISYVCLGDSSENETAKRAAHPKGWRGTEIPNKKKDSAKKLINLLQFLRPCFELGNKKGDKVNFDEVGTMFMVKTEPESDGPSTPSETESEDSENAEDEADNENANDEVTQGTDAPITEPYEPPQMTEPVSVDPLQVTEQVPEKPSQVEEPDTTPDEEPCLSGTQNQVTNNALDNAESGSDSDIEFVAEVTQKPKTTPIIVDIDAEDSTDPTGKIKTELKAEPGVSSHTNTAEKTEIEIMKAQILALTNALNLNLNRQAEPETSKPKVEPKIEEPPQEESENESDGTVDDTEEVIQSLEAHLEATEQAPQNQSPQPQTGEDSGMEEPDPNESTKVFNLSGYETETDIEKREAIREEILADSEDDNSGIETVRTSGEEEVAETNSPKNEKPDKSGSNDKEVPRHPSLMPNPKPKERSTQDSGLNPTVVLEPCEAPAANDNNNVEKPKFVLESTSHHPVTDREDRQIIVHQTPVRFPAGGNLMENPETQMFVTNALVAVTEPVVLPGNAVVSASLRNNMENRQNQATVVLELKSTELKQQIMKLVKEYNIKQKGK